MFLKMHNISNIKSNSLETVIESVNSLVGILKLPWSLNQQIILLVYLYIVKNL